MMKMTSNTNLRHNISSFSYPILLSVVDTVCFHHVVIQIRQLFLRTAACLTSTYLETGVPTSFVPTNDYKCSWDQRLAFRSTEELEIINFGHPSDDWPLRTLLSFRDRMLSALTVGPSSSSWAYIWCTENNIYIIQIHSCYLSHFDVNISRTYIRHSPVSDY
jgi:hypothetical protein